MFKHISQIESHVRKGKGMSGQSTGFGANMKSWRLTVINAANQWAAV